MRVALWTAIWACAMFALAQDADLILYYDYEDFDGATAIDMSGNARNGVVKGDVSLEHDGERGNVAHFEQGSYIDLDGENWPEELTPRSGMTVSAWVHVKAVADQAIFNARASDATWIVHPEIRGDGNYRWLLRGDGGAGIFDIRAGVAKAEEWVHYAGTYNGSQAALYINGEMVGSQAAKGLIAKDWGMGARVGYNIDNNRPFNGWMDDLNLWKRGLSEEEVRMVMEFGPLPQSVSPRGKAAAAWGDLKRNE